MDSSAGGSTVFDFMVIVFSWCQIKFDCIDFAIIEPRREKTGFLHLRKQRTLIYLNPKFQGSNHLLWLYSPVCVGHGRKPRRPVFSQRGSYMCDLVYYVE